MIGWTYLKSVLRREGIPLRLLALVLLAVLAALLEGVGMGFLIPIIESLQELVRGEAGGSSLSGIVSRVFSFLGLPFTLAFILAVGLGLYFGQLGLVYGRTLLTARTQNQLVLDLRSKAFASLLDFDLAFFHRSRLGGLVSTLTTETYRAGYAFRSMVEMLASLLLLGAYAAVEFMVDWKLALLVFPVLGLSAVLVRPRQSYELGTEQTQQNDCLQSTAVETLAGIREIKALGIGALSFSRFRQAAVSLARLDILLWKEGAQFGLIYQCVAISVIVALVYVASRLEGMGLAPLLVFLVVLQRMAPRFSAFTEQRHWWLGSAHSMLTVEVLLTETARTHTSVRSGTVPFRDLERGIEIKELRFRHAGQSVDTLAGVSFTIPRGKTVAIVGASGAGKSTLIDLLVGFYDPDAGCIRVDGRDLRDLDLASWRAAIGLMSQDTFLFNDTIESNMRCGDVNITMAAIEEAARRAHAHEFICQLPQGYATVIGDRGVKLSGGQRQRLALARVLLRQPQMLILDEATNSLDSESERYIQEALHEIGLTCTVVVVAHRLSTIEHADMIIVLESGRVVEQGTYAELLACGGRFAKFHQLQCKGLSVPPGRS